MHYPRKTFLKDLLFPNIDASTLLLGTLQPILHPPSITRYLRVKRWRGLNRRTRSQSLTQPWPLTAKRVESRSSCLLFYPPTHSIRSSLECITPLEKHRHRFYSPQQCRQKLAFATCSIASASKASGPSLPASAKRSIHKAGLSPKEAHTKKVLKGRSDGVTPLQILPDGEKAPVLADPEHHGEASRRREIESQALLKRQRDGECNDLLLMPVQGVEKDLDHLHGERSRTREELDVYRQHVQRCETHILYSGLLDDFSQSLHHTKDSINAWTRNICQLAESGRRIECILLDHFHRKNPLRLTTEAIAETTLDIAVILRGQLWQKTSRGFTGNVTKLRRSLGDNFRIPVPTSKGWRNIRALLPQLLYNSGELQAVAHFLREELKAKALDRCFPTHLSPGIPHFSRICSVASMLIHETQSSLQLIFGFEKANAGVRRRRRTSQSSYAARVLLHDQALQCQFDALEIRALCRELFYVDSRLAQTGRWCQESSLGLLHRYLERSVLFVQDRCYEWEISRPRHKSRAAFDQENTPRSVEEELDSGFAYGRQDSVWRRPSRSRAARIHVTRRELKNLNYELRLWVTCFRYWHIIRCMATGKRLHQPALDDRNLSDVDHQSSVSASSFPEPGFLATPPSLEAPSADFAQTSLYPKQHNLRIEHIRDSRTAYLAIRSFVGCKLVAVDFVLGDRKLTEGDLVPLLTVPHLVVLCIANEDRVAIVDMHDVASDLRHAYTIFGRLFRQSLRDLFHNIQTLKVGVNMKGLASIMRHRYGVTMENYLDLDPTLEELNFNDFQLLPDPNFPILSALCTTGLRYELLSTTGTPWLDQMWHPETLHHFASRAHALRCLWHTQATRALDVGIAPLSANDPSPESSSKSDEETTSLTFSRNNFTPIHIDPLFLLRPILRKPLQRETYLNFLTKIMARDVVREQAIQMTHSERSTKLPRMQTDLQAYLLFTTFNESLEATRDTLRVEKIERNPYEAVIAASKQIQVPLHPKRMQKLRVEAEVLGFLKTAPTEIPKEPPKPRISTKVSRFADIHLHAENLLLSNPILASKVRKRDSLLGRSTLVSWLINAKQLEDGTGYWWASSIRKRMALSFPDYVSDILSSLNFHRANYMPVNSATLGEIYRLLNTYRQLYADKDPLKLVLQLDGLYEDLGAPEVTELLGSLFPSLGVAIEASRTKRKISQIPAPDHFDSLEGSRNTVASQYGAATSDCLTPSPTAQERREEEMTSSGAPEKRGGPAGVQVEPRLGGNSLAQTRGSKAVKANVALQRETTKPTTSQERRRNRRRELRRNRRSELRKAQEVGKAESGGADESSVRACEEEDHKWIHLAEAKPFS